MLSDIGEYEFRVVTDKEWVSNKYSGACLSDVHFARIPHDS